MTIQTIAFVLDSTFCALPIPEAFGQTPYLENIVANMQTNNLVEDQNKIIEAIPYRNVWRYALSAWVIGKTLGGTASMLGYDEIATAIESVAEKAGTVAFGAFWGYQYKMSQTVLWDDSVRVMI